MPSLRRRRRGPCGKHCRHGTEEDDRDTDYQRGRHPAVEAVQDTGQCGDRQYREQPAADVDPFARVVVLPGTISVAARVIAVRPTLNANTDRHENASSSPPAVRRPINAPPTVTPDQMPTARPRSSGGNTRVMIDSVIGITAAAPIPAIARIAMITGMSSSTSTTAEDTRTATTRIPAELCDRSDLLMPLPPAAIPRR